MNYYYNLGYQHGLMEKQALDPSTAAIIGALGGGATGAGLGYFLSPEEAALQNALIGGGVGALGGGLLGGGLGAAQRNWAAIKLLANEAAKMRSSTEYAPPPVIPSKLYRQGEFI